VVLARGRQSVVRLVVDVGHLGPFGSSVTPGPAT